MDIAALSMNMAANNIQSAVGISMLSKSIDSSQASAERITDMISTSDMERSVYPNLGTAIDLYV